MKNLRGLAKKFKVCFDPHKVRPKNKGFDRELVIKNLRGGRLRKSLLTSKKPHLHQKGADEIKSFGLDFEVDFDQENGHFDLEKCPTTIVEKLRRYKK